MNRTRSTGLPVPPTLPQRAFSPSLGWLATLIILEISAASSAVYQPLTLIGKDCGHLGKKHRRGSGANQSRPPFERAAASARAQAATENRHGFKSRAQAT